MVHASDQIEVQAGNPCAGLLAAVEGQTFLVGNVRVGHDRKAEERRAICRIHHWPSLIHWALVVKCVTRSPCTLRVSFIYESGPGVPASCLSDAWNSSRTWYNGASTQVSAR